jgi:hypothetical protein
MIVALVPALVLAAIGFGVRGTLRTGAAALAASLGVFVAVLGFVTTDPATQRHDWRALARVMPHGPQARLYIVPKDGRTPLQYYTRKSLTKFEPKHFRDGVATSHVVVISDYPAITGPGPGFRLIDTRTAPQHWTVKIYSSRRPRPINPGQVAGTRVMVQPSTALVADGDELRHAEVAVDGRSPPV